MGSDGRPAAGEDASPRGERAGSAPGAAHPARRLETTVVEYEDRPDECTICPRGVGRDRLTTTWITARADAFVDLAEVR